MKSFNSVNWDLFFSSYGFFRFPSMLIQWVACVCSLMFSVKFIQALAGNFKGARGLRPGFPPSHYLFFYCCDVLSLMSYYSYFKVSLEG